MLRLLAFAVMLLSHAPAHAQNVDKDLGRLAALARAGGAEAKIESFNVSDYSEAAMKRQLTATLRSLDRECEHSPLIGREHIVLQIELFESFIDNGDEVARIAQRLDRQKQLLGGFGYYWDGLNGEEEDCAHESLHLYFRNEKSLSVRKGEAD